MSPTHARARAPRDAPALLAGCVLPLLALLPGDDVACLLLIGALLAAGGGARAALLDGFRCDCIRIFLHPRFLDVAGRGAWWGATSGAAYLARKAHAWTAAHGFSNARIPQMSGTTATLMFPSDH
ncbi:hypothetical protein PsYK624_059160 [Phanerochaete sordida]|uniref:Uncharacterized protein n=1 Tax=Phanerochaete sordida TaxID=48140 RepID=A0A9P3G5W5_9APHY|nr:hypothetical protein PsYK624_059160 [Phanerochaete sordida]